MSSNSHPTKGDLRKIPSAAAEALTTHYNGPTKRDETGRIPVWTSIGTDTRLKLREAMRAVLQETQSSSLANWLEENPDEADERLKNKIKQLRMRETERSRLHDTG